MSTKITQTQKLKQTFKQNNQIYRFVIDIYETGNEIKQIKPFEIFVDKCFAILNGCVPNLPNQLQSVSGTRPETRADIGECGCCKIPFKV